MAEVAEEVPCSAVQRVSLAGATLASLLSSAACSKGAGGDLLLLGCRASRYAAASKREADAGTRAGAQVLDAQVVVAAALPQRLAFYGAVGDVDVDKLDEAVDRARRGVQDEGEAALGEGGTGPLGLELLGWCSVRPCARLAPSVREAAVTRALQATGRCSVAPLLLLVGALPASDGGAGSLVLSTEYACVQVDAVSGELLPCAVHVLNLGAAGGEYGALAAVSPAPGGGMMGAGRRLEELAQAAEVTARGVEALVGAQADKLEEMERVLQQLRAAAPLLPLPSPPLQDPQKEEKPDYHDQLKGLVASLADAVPPPDAAAQNTAAEARASGGSSEGTTGAPSDSSELSEMALEGSEEGAKVGGDPSTSIEESPEEGLPSVESRSAAIVCGSRAGDGIGGPPAAAADNEGNQAREEEARQRDVDPYAEGASDGGSSSEGGDPWSVVDGNNGDHQIVRNIHPKAAHDEAEQTHASAATPSAPQVDDEELCDLLR